MRKILFILLGVLIITSCVEKRDLKQDVVVVDLESYPDGLHPYNSSSGSGNFITSYTQTSLISLDSKTEQYTPLLIKELPKADSTGLLYRFEINNKAKWDNGEILKGEDVVFSWKLTLCPLTDNAFARGMYSNIIENVFVNPENSQEVFVKVQDVHYKNMEIVASVSLSQKSYWDKENLMDEYSFKDLLGKEFKSTKKLDDWFNNFNSADNAYIPENLKGLGAYQITQMVSKSYITLEKKKGWWGTPFKEESTDFIALPQKIIFKVTSDPSAGYLAIKAEEIDILKNRGSSWISKFRRLRRLEYFNENYKSDFVETNLYRYLGMNLKPDGKEYKPFFTDVRVRRAMAHLAPLDDMIEYLLYGEATRQASIVAPFNKAVDSTLKLIPYNIKEANRLLSEAGWVDTDGDNIRDKMIDGEKVQFSFKLNYYSDPSLKEIATVLKGSMRKAGIELIQNPLDFGTLFGNAYDHKFDAILAAWGGSVMYSDPYAVWSSKSWATKGANFIGFGDAESDSLINASNTILDEEGHLKAFRALQRKIYEEQPYIFFWSEKYVMACHNRFENNGFFKASPNINVAGLKLKYK